MGFEDIRACVPGDGIPGSAFCARQKSLLVGCLFRNPGIFKILGIVGHAPLFFPNVELGVQCGRLPCIESFCFPVDLGWDGLLATPARQVQPVAPADHLEGAIVALPHLDRAYAGPVEGSTQGDDHAFSVRGHLELGDFLGQLQILERNLVRLQVRDRFPGRHVHLDRISEQIDLGWRECWGIGWRICIFQGYLVVFLGDVTNLKGFPCVKIPWKNPGSVRTCDNSCSCQLRYFGDVVVISQRGNTSSDS